MSADIAMKACSTFVAFLALVSMKGMPISSANAYQKTRHILAKGLTQSAALANVNNYKNPTFAVS